VANNTVPANELEAEEADIIKQGLIQVFSLLREKYGYMGTLSLPPLPTKRI
jgi:hypothetical protein